MAIDILVEQIAEAPRSTRIASLRTKSAQPHEIASFHFDPILIEAIDRFAFEHIEPVLHNMRFSKGDYSTGLEGDDVVAQRPSVPGITLGLMSFSLAITGSGVPRPSTAS